MKTPMPLKERALQITFYLADFPEGRTRRDIQAHFKIGEGTISKSLKIARKQGWVVSTQLEKYTHFHTLFKDQAEQKRLDYEKRLRAIERKRATKKQLRQKELRAANALKIVEKTARLLLKHPEGLDAVVISSHLKLSIETTRNHLYGEKIEGKIKKVLVDRVPRYFHINHSEHYEKALKVKAEKIKARKKALSLLKPKKPRVKKSNFRKVEKPVLFEGITYMTDRDREAALLARQANTALHNIFSVTANA